MKSGQQPPAPEFPPPRQATAAPRSPSELLMPTRPPRPLKPLKHERTPRRANGFLRFLDGLLSFALIVFIMLAALTLWLHQGFDQRGPLSKTATVVVPKGVGALEVAERLERAGVVDDRRLFMLRYYVAKFSGSTALPERATLKAGEYEFSPGASVRQVLDTIVSGRGILQKVTLPEGLTTAQIVERLNSETGLSGTIAKMPEEGTLLPETYRFSRDTPRQEIIERMRADQVKVLQALWATRQKDLPIATPEQAVVLASIVEKETSKEEERPLVAAVFVNRLRKGMRLQSDPTIIYGLVGGKGTLGRGITRSDIDSKTPYNTYQIDGLPPGPICNPGRASIAAVLNPATTKDLYFVADGSGGHTFTTNLKDHNAAVANWRRIERGRQAKDGAEAPQAAAQVPTPINAAKVPSGSAKRGKAGKKQ